MKTHPIQFLRMMGILDGISLLTLLFISMPLKYYVDFPQFVTINGSIHGGIFVLYLIAIAYAQLRVQWNFLWSIVAVLVAFIPFGNFIFDWRLKKVKANYTIKPFQKKWIVYLIIFFSFIDLFAQLPVMSTFALSVGASTFIAGIVVGMYSFTNTFGNVLSGIFTDRIGAFNMLLFGLVMTVLSLASYQVVDDSTTLLIVRCMHGFSSGFITPAAFTLLANTTKDSKQGSNSAVTGSFVGIAAIIGPATSGILASKMAVPNVLGIVGILGFILIIGLFVFLRGDIVKKVAEQSEKRKFGWNIGLLKAFSGAFFLMFSQGVLAYLLPMYVEDLGYNSRMSGTLMSVFGIVAVLIFVLPTNKIFDRVNSSCTLIIGVTLIGISQIGIGQVTSIPSLYGMLALYGVGFAFLFPSINTLLIESTTKETRGKAYGYFYAFFSIGVVVGSVLLGTLGLTGTAGFLFTGIVLIAFGICVLLSIIRSKESSVIWKNNMN